KALRGLETGSFGLGNYRGDLWGTARQPSIEDIIARLATPTAERIWYIRYAFKARLSLEDIHQHTKIDPWFLHNIQELVEKEDRLRTEADLLRTRGDRLRDVLLEAKQYGFSDKQLAFLWHSSEREIRRLRKELGVVPT